MQPHTIASYDAELKALDALVGDMAGRAETSLEDAAKALFAGNVRLAQQVIAGDAAIDLLQHNIEDRAISTIATRQPVAIDLRQIVSTIRIASPPRSRSPPAWRRWRRACAISCTISPPPIATAMMPARSRCGGRTEPSTRCTPRCSASCSPT
jgi:phosphate transport system protein